MMQKTPSFGSIPIVHSALVAGSLYLLTGCISSQWQDLVHILLSHPKVKFITHYLSKVLLVQ